MSESQKENTQAPVAAPPGRVGGIRSGKLVGKSMSAAIWILAWPVLLQQTMQACVGMADKLFAGQLPEPIRLTAMDAIGIGSYIGWFIGIAMSGLGIGGQAIIARSMGAGDLSLGHRALGQAISMSLLWGVLVGVVLWSSATPVAAACRLSAQASEQYRDYIRILACAMPMAGVMLVGAMCLHGAGETMKPAIIAIAVNLLNIVSSWMLSGVDLRFGVGPGAFVFDNPFPFDLHVRGIAAGTAISYVAGAVLTVRVLTAGVKDLRLERQDLALDRSMVRRVIRIGLPNFFEGISMWSVNLVVLVLIGIIAVQSTGGAGLQGAHIIAVQWESFSFLPGFAIGTAAGALAGQYLGAGDRRAALKAILVCTGIAIVVMGLLGLVFVFFGRQLTALISTEPLHLEYTPRLLFICGTVQVFFAISMVVRQGLARRRGYPLDAADHHGLQLRGEASRRVHSRCPAGIWTRGDLDGLVRRVHGALGALHSPPLQRGLGAVECVRRVRSGADGQSLGEDERQAGLQRSLLRGTDVVLDPVHGERRRGRIEYREAGSRVAVARLADRSWIADVPSIRAQPMFETVAGQIRHDVRCLERFVHRHRARLEDHRDVCVSQQADSTINPPKRDGRGSLIVNVVVWTGHRTGVHAHDVLPDVAEGLHPVQRVKMQRAQLVDRPMDGIPGGPVERPCAVGVDD